MSSVLLGLSEGPQTRCNNGHRPKTVLLRHMSFIAFTICVRTATEVPNLFEKPVDAG
ncbi:hypothetical protein M378DRAFT_160717 [Amanita muscaria Koide BX008]|uniref:Uncharacterized protein n=1 Tax=Amanita muscaria (strain Koide BX008) TaxID=946122 RepID=A0A0C2TI96_AMAMK|nr:hypothetical protein M378DRAFT_160717 [Amanita muscaria Koide BX008]